MDSSATRRAVLATLAAVLPATASALPPTPGDAFDAAAAEWIHEFIKEGGSIAPVPSQPEVLWFGSKFYDGGRSNEMLAAMTPANPLRPRVRAMAQRMISAGVL